MGDRIIAGVFSFAINLPFIETVLYNSLINGKSPNLMLYIEVGIALLIGWLLMFVAFVVDKNNLAQSLAVLHFKMVTLRNRTKQHLSFLLYLVPIFFLIVFIIGKVSEELVRLFQSKFTEAVVLIGLWLLMGILCWFVGRLLAALTEIVATDLHGVLQEWSLSIRISFLYYIFIVSFAWFAIGPGEIVNDNVRFSFYFGFAKDIVLMWIIAELLFVSLYKLGHHGNLVRIFQSISGYVQFVVICGIIAIFATWADFGFIQSQESIKLYPEDWQQRLIKAHIYIRDIFLLLLPIAALLIWTLKRVAAEIKKNKRSKARKSKKRIEGDAKGNSGTSIGG